MEFPIRSKHWILGAFIAVLYLTSEASQPIFGQLLYVGNSGDDSISTFVIDQQTGLLTELLPRVGTPGSPSSVAIHPSGKYVYATNSGNANLGVNAPSLATFTINPDTGALSLTRTLTLTPGTGPQGAAIDPAGQFLLVANNGPGNVSVYSIDTATGSLTQVPGSPFSVPAGPNFVAVHPSGKFVFVSSNTAAQISAFQLGKDGGMTAVAGSPAAARNNILSMAMDPLGRFLFVVERQDNAVLVYSIDPGTGALTQVGSPVSAGPGAAGAVVDSTGKLLYVATSNSGAVAVFKINDSGKLTQAGAFGTIIGSFIPVMDPSGKFLYVTGPPTGAIAGFSLAPDTGALTPLPQQFFGAGNNPQRAATVLLNPPVLPPMRVDTISNYYSHALPGSQNAGLAQGSRIAISGTNLGPTPDLNSVFPIGTDLGGVSVQIQSGQVTTSALIVQAANTLVTAVIPSGTPLGDATITLSYNGRTTAAIPVTIAATSVGIRSLSDTGYGPAKAWFIPSDTTLAPDPALLQAPVYIDSPATPGQLVIVAATGLGATAIDETQNAVEVLGVPAKVVVGNQLVNAVYEVRGSQGVDYIVFQLPADAVTGCYVPVTILAGGVTSNTVSLSISPDGTSCSDPMALSAADIDAARNAGGIRMATLALSRLAFGLFGPSDNAQGFFYQYTFDTMRQGYSLGNDGAGIRAGVAIPPMGACTVMPGGATNPQNPFNTTGNQPPPSQAFNVGSALNMTSPIETVQLKSPNYRYQPDGDSIVPGDYTIDNGDGTKDYGPFKATLTMSAPLNWTNQNAIGSVDRAQDLTLTWSGGNPTKEYALIAGVAASNQVVSGFLCTADVSAGQFTVPSWILSTLPQSGMFAAGDVSIPGGLLALGTASFSSAGRFTAPGVDFGSFTYEQATIALAPYQ